MHTNTNTSCHSNGPQVCNTVHHITIPSKHNPHLQFLLKAPAADWVIYDESPQDYTRENSPQHEILWKQFTLNVAKGVARKILVHGYPCTGEGGVGVRIEV